MLFDVMVDRTVGWSQTRSLCEALQEQRLVASSATRRAFVLELAAHAPIVVNKIFYRNILD